MNKDLVVVQMNGKIVYVTKEEKEKIFKRTLKGLRKIRNAKYYGDAFNMYLPRTPESQLVEA